MTKREQVVGGGPWTFENSNALDSNEVFKKNFFDEVYKGKKGYFRDYLPLTSIQVSNLNSSNAVVVTINNNGSYYIPPKTTEGLDNEQITSFSIENVGSTEISSDEIRVDVRKDPYDSDRKAMEEKLTESSPAMKNIKKMVGLFL